MLKIITVKAVYSAVYTVKFFTEKGIDLFIEDTEKETTVKALSVTEGE